MMGGGGSMQSMQTTLKNNKNLRKSRNSYFNKELSFEKLKKFGKKSSLKISGGKKADETALRKIREKLLSEQRKRTVFFILFGIIVTIVITFFGYHFIFDVKPSNPSFSYGKVEVPYFIENTNFHQSIYRADQQMKSENYFLAIGNYQKALQKKAGNIQAEYGLAKAYSKACRANGIFCEEAQTFIKKMEIKYPDQESFSKLHKTYLVEKKD